MSNRASTSKANSNKKSNNKRHAFEEYNYNKKGNLTPDSAVKHQRDRHLRQPRISSFFENFDPDTNESGTSNNSGGLINDLLDSGVTDIFGNLFTGNYIGAGTSAIRSLYNYTSKKNNQGKFGTVEEEKNSKPFSFFEEKYQDLNDNQHNIYRSNQEDQDLDWWDDFEDNFDVNRFQSNRQEEQQENNISDQSQVSEMANTPGASGDANIPMDTTDGAAGNTPAPAARAGSGPGHGAVGAQGVNATNIYNANHRVKHGIPFKREYIKSYRYILPACQSRMFKVAAPANNDNSGGDIINVEETFFVKIASSCYVPMEYLFLYMDPRDYHQIYNQYNEFKIHRVGAKVTTLGVRAPYTTGQSNIEVANANLQATLVDLTPMAFDYPIISGGTDRPDIETPSYLAPNNTINQIFNQITGSVFASDNAGGVNTNINKGTFENVSSRFETRRWHPRAWIVLPERAHYVDLQYGYIDGYHHSWPNYCNYIEKMINGSNHLGVAFMKKYDVERTIWERTQPHHQWPKNSTPQNDADIGLNRQDELAGRYRQETTEMVNKHSSGTRLQPPTTSTMNDYTSNIEQLGVERYQTANVFGYSTVNEAEPDTRQCPFIFAMYNVRNITTDVETDISTGSPANDIVDLNLEFILDVAMEASGYMEMPIYWNPTIRPTPKWTRKRRLLANHTNIVIGTENRFKRYLNAIHCGGR